MTESRRRVLLVTHTGRAAATASAALLVKRLQAAGIEVLAPEVEAVELALPGLGIWAADGRDVELIVVLGGDGSILRGAELARRVGTPLLGVNLGRVGFLAEVEEQDLVDVAERIGTRQYTV